MKLYELIFSLLISVVAIFLVTLVNASETLAKAEPIIIAHRGASGYLPEHTLAAKAMAYAMRVDYIEQDVVLTKDSEPIVLHDHLLDRVTDVATRYPERAREDGRYYALDFTLAEIRKLAVTERFDIIEGKEFPVFPDRFPTHNSRFRIHTLSEEIEFIQGLNKSTGKNVGIYVEIKSPAFHLSEGHDISLIVLKVLKHYGYTSRADKVFLQTFELDENIRIREVIFPAMKMDLKLIQLMTEEPQYQPLLTIAGMGKLAKYVDGIAPSYPMALASALCVKDQACFNITHEAHRVNLKVHIYSLRRDDPALAEIGMTFEQLVKKLFDDIGVDGAFTDFPDILARKIKK